MVKLRVLGGVRQSVTRDNSVRVVSQKREVIRWSAAPSPNAEVVGWANDTDVSGSIDPFERPELSRWLTERIGQWDVLCAPRVRGARVVPRADDEWGELRGPVRALLTTYGAEERRRLTAMPSQVMRWPRRTSPSAQRRHLLKRVMNGGPNDSVSGR
jgi:hypothetical protein